MVCRRSRQVMESTASLRETVPPNAYVWVRWTTSSGTPGWRNWQTRKLEVLVSD